MEVVAATAIFLFAFVAIGSLIESATLRDYESRLYATATQMAQSKLAEFASGVQFLPSNLEADQPYDPEGKIKDLANWVWSVKCTPGGDPGGLLWTVAVTVKFMKSEGGNDAQGVNVTLVQMILDPSMRGTTMGMNPVTPPTSKKSTTTTKAAGG